jgi:hypothetical protein
MVILDNPFQEKYLDIRNIGPLKYRFQLSIFQISYSIDYINYQLSHGISTPSPPDQEIVACRSELRGHSFSPKSGTPALTVLKKLLLMGLHH